MRLLLLSLSACASGAFRAPWSGGARPIAPVVLPSSPQLLRFVDPKTQGEVVLVGTMHYNPSSIALAADTVRAAAEAQELRAVLVESCPTRWNATLAMQPQGSHKPIHHSHSHSHIRHSPYLSHTCRILVAYLSHTCSLPLPLPHSPLSILVAYLSHTCRILVAYLFAGSLLRTVCDNEMQAAAEVAEAYGRPVELGDQTLETTFLRIGQLLALTLVQLLTPQGWQRIAEDFALGSEQLSCPGESVGTGGKHRKKAGEPKKKKKNRRLCTRQRAALVSRRECRHRRQTQKKAGEPKRKEKKTEDFALGSEQFSCPGESVGTGGKTRRKAGYPLCPH